MEKVTEKSKNQKNLKEYNERLQVYGNDLKNLYQHMYGDYDNYEQYYDELLNIMEKSFKSRKRSLRILDRVREEDSYWFLRQDKIGYAIYLDLFCKDLKGLKSKIDYIKELNITYLHIMEFNNTLNSKDNEEYGQLEKIIDMFRKEKISVGVDFYMINTQSEEQSLKNPLLFNEIINNILHIFNRGIEILNIGDKSLVVKICKIITKIVCPSVILRGDEFSISDNNSLMLLLWNSLATRDVRIMTEHLKQSINKLQELSYINYSRCNNNIDWEFNDEIIKQFGFSPVDHKQFIIDFYSGNFQGSFAKGQIYEIDNFKRTSGTLASLCGLEKALEECNLHEIYLSQRRIILLNSVVLAYSGIPMLYSGDEIGQLNDYWYISDHNKKHDSRWLHRPAFNWDRAKNRNDITRIEGNIFNNIKKFIEIRNNYDIFRSDIISNVINTNNNSIFAFFKRNKDEELLVLGNFSEYHQVINLDNIRKHELNGIFINLGESLEVDLDNNEITLKPYDCIWLYKNINK